MRILFIYNGTESLGIEYLSSFLKSKGHTTFLFFDPAIFSGDVFINNHYLSKLFDVERKIVEKTIKLKPDIVAFSAYSGNYRWCLRIAYAIRKLSDIPIVFGGVHPTAVPERVLANDCIDYLIVGEGEYAMLDLIEHLEGSSKYNTNLINTANIGLRHEGHIIVNSPRPYIRDLDSLPFPDKALFFNKEPLLKNDPYLIMTSRGCPYNCTYCSNDLYKTLYCDEKQHIRRRSPDNVIAELAYAKVHAKIRRVNFMDDVFASSKLWLEEFTEKYRTRIGLPFHCLVHPLSITKDIAKLLKEAGCDLVGIGIQSGSERIRNTIYERKESNEQIKQAISILKNVKLKVKVDHIFGAPTETEEDLKKSLALYQSIKPEMILTFWLTYYPQTAIIKKALELGVLRQKDIEQIEEGYTGYTHGIGSVPTESVALFARYEVLFELLALCPNEAICLFLSKLIPFTPLKKWISYSAYTITGLRHYRDGIFNKFRYALSKHNAP